MTTIVLTGGNQRTATAIAIQAGIGDARGDLLPDDRLRIITELVASGGPVAMVGDGVDDAPRLPKQIWGSQWEQPEPTQRSRRPPSR